MRENGATLSLCRAGNSLIYLAHPHTRMAEITIRIGGRNVSVELSEGEARKILNDLIFRSTEPTEEIRISTRPEVASEFTSSASGESVSGSDFLPIPSRDEIMTFIRSQPEYVHSVESAAEHFAHKEVSTADGRAADLWLNSIRGYCRRIRDEIAQNEKGTWKEDRRGRRKTFRFVRQEDNKMESQGSLLQQFEEGDRTERE